MHRFPLIAISAILLYACQSPVERAAGELAKRIVPSCNITFRQVKDSIENYRLLTEGKSLIVEGSSLSAMAVGLNRYLNDFCNTSVSWYAAGAAMPSGEKGLSVMTYNVGVFSKSGKDCLQDVASLIRESGATIVALNELDSCNRRHQTFQLAELARAVGGWDFHFTSTFPFAGGAYGNGILSREPILWSGKISLPQADGAEPRCAAVVETASCVFASVHLDHVGKEARQAQARTLNDWFTAHYSGYGKPVLLCGDFNSEPGSGTLAVLDDCWQRLSPSEATHNDGKCLDHIFALRTAAPVRVLYSAVLRSSLSDHSPLILKGYL